jgi:hypothetical protein
MVSMDARLAAWIRSHGHLQPVEVKWGTVLPILREVDHEMSFSSRTAGRLPDTRMGFTRRPTAQVSADDELQEWLVSRHLQVPWHLAWWPPTTCAGHCK